MTSTRTRAARALLPLALAGLLVSACSSGTDAAGDPPPAASSAPAPEEEPAEAEPMTDDMAADESSAEAADADAMGSDTMAADAEEPTGPGAYITFAEYEGSKDMYSAGDVVLFFNAEWCSTCKEARDNIQADLAAIPAGLTIVTVDYDTAEDLKRQYGVTVQHTFVQVDPEGNELAKWSGSVTAEEIAENTV